MSVLFGFFLIFLLWFFQPAPALGQALQHFLLNMDGGQVGAVFIDPEDPSQVIRVQVPHPAEVLLKIQDLPKTSAAHPAVILANEKFTFVTPSPDHKQLAFCVDARAHDWTGTVNLADGQVRQVGLSYEAEATQPGFSEDGRYLIMEENQSQGRSGLEVFDLEKGTACRVDGRRVRDKFLNFSAPWWSPGSDTLYFKVEYNNRYRKSLGLRPKQFVHRIGEVNPECGRIRYYSVSEFIQMYPDQSPYSELALQKKKIE